MVCRRSKPTPPQRRGAHRPGRPEGSWLVLGLGLGLGLVLGLVLDARECSEVDLAIGPEVVLVAVECTW